MLVSLMLPIALLAPAVPYLNYSNIVSRSGLLELPLKAGPNPSSLSISPLVFGNELVKDISGSNTCKERFIL